MSFMFGNHLKRKDLDSNAEKIGPILSGSCHKEGPRAALSEERSLQLSCQLEGHITMKNVY